MGEFGESVEAFHAFDGDVVAPADFDDVPAFGGGFCGGREDEGVGCEKEGEDQDDPRGVGGFFAQKGHEFLNGHDFSEFGGR